MTVWIAVSRFLASLVLGATLVGAAAAQPVKTAHLEAELVAQGQAAPGGETYVALVQKLEPGWHSYWRNPGSAGEATQLLWTLPKGWSAGDIVWAAPQRIPVGPLVSFGYEDEVVLPVPIKVPADAPPGSRHTLKAEAAFLVCKEICIPAQASLSVDLTVSATPAPDARGGALVAAALEAAPKPAGLSAVFARDGNVTRLAITGAALKSAPITEAFFFPFNGAVLDAAAAQPVELGPEGLTLKLTPQPNASVAPLAGVLSLGDRAYEITAAEGALPAGASGEGMLKAASEPSTSALGLPLALLFAFVGGLILNLMPCVLPILSMKGAQLAAHAHEPRAARAQGLAFLFGCLATFLAIAAAMLALRAAGAEIGWGFQLQSPAVVAGLALLMLLVALNLAGLFEVGTSVQGLGSGLSARSGLLGALLTGVLAVVVAAPCTAPFMAAALGYAIAQPAPVALAAFSALGLGFALPFTALSFAPGLLRRLPRMGPWMTTFRTALAFPMLGAAAWMAWVLAAQAGSHALAALLAAALVLSFAAWLFGHGQRAFGARARIGLGAALPVGILIAVMLLVPALRRPAAPARTAQGAALTAVPWSAQAVANRTGVVLVDFTAAWCITCQVNERVALSSPAIAQTFAKAGAVYMKADWTNRDPAITRALAEHGRAGVPLYLVYPAKGEPKVLPQLLSEGMVREAVEAAARAG